MTVIQVIFYVFATIAVGSGMMVVASNNPVKGALYLVLTFFAMAGVWMLMQAEFLALILVLVYVGAVMTLFLFVVMMLRVNVVKMFEGFVSYFPLAVLIVLLMIGFSILVVGPDHFGLNKIMPPPARAADYSNLNALGMVLYTDYALPFEISAIILLTAIIAAISLSHRKPKNRKNQVASKQINIKRSDRVKLLKMPFDKKIKVSREL